MPLCLPASLPKYSPSLYEYSEYSELTLTVAHVVSVFFLHCNSAMQILLSENADAEPRLQALQGLNSVDLQTASLVADRMFGAREDSLGLGGHRRDRVDVDCHFR